MYKRQFTTGVGVGFSFSVNAMAGPVPLTATFELGGAIQLDFRTAVRYGQQGQGLSLIHILLVIVDADVLDQPQLLAQLQNFSCIGGQGAADLGGRCV